MGIGEAAQRWSLTRSELVLLCEEGRVQAVCLDGECWALLRDQPHPVTGEPAPRSGKAKTDKASYMSSRLLDALYE